MGTAGQIILPYGDAPGTPSSGKITIYVDNNKTAYYKDDDGTLHPMTPSGVVTDHGDLDGLPDDDHTQYHTDARGDIRYYTQAQVDTISGSVVSQIPTDFYTTGEIDTISGSLSSEIGSDISTHASSADHDGRYYTETEVDLLIAAVSSGITLLELTDTPSAYDTDKYLRSTTSGTEWATVSGGTGTSDHGELSGLADDDHTQYHTDARGDARYYTETELNNGQLDNRYYTETELNNGQLDNRYYTETELNAGQLDSLYYTQVTLSGGVLDNRYYTETELDAGQLDNRYYTEAEVNTISGNITAQIIMDHGVLAGLGDDDHTQYLNITRGDVRYYTETELDAGQLDNRYYTETEIDATLSGTTPITVKDEGGDVTNTPHTALNFTGAGVTVSNAGAGVATIDIPAASGGLVIKDEGTTVSGGPHTTMSFTGQMVTATNAGGGAVTINIPYPTFGTWYGWAVSEAQSSSNSTAWNQKLRYTTPVMTVGYYRIGWFFELRRDSTNTDFMAQVQIDDTTTIMSINYEVGDVTTWVSQSGYYIASFTSAAHTIDLDYSGATTAGTSYIRRARIEMWRVS